MREELPTSNLEACIAGRKLYGDDFNIQQVAAWYADEAEAYAHLLDDEGEQYRYRTHALDWRDHFRFLPEGRIGHALGFGSARGDELTPLLNRIDQITIVDPSDDFVRDLLNGVPVRYVKPEIDGRMPFNDNTFDMLTCFGVLHHIPIVSAVVKEFYRCLKPGGLAFVREPTVSMGEWWTDKPRPGLTKRERGIPLPVFQEIVVAAGFEVLHQRRVSTPFTERFSRILGLDYFNSEGTVKLDAALCRLMMLNKSYHATHVLKKFRPLSLAMTLRKPVTQ